MTGKLAPKFDAILLDPADNVVVALVDLAAGRIVRIGGPDGEQSLAVIEDIPFCHKLAVTEIGPGEAVCKQGRPIGEATRAIPAGGHVHVHNIRGPSPGVGGNGDRG